MFEILTEPLVSVFNARERFLERERFLFIYINFFWRRMGRIFTIEGSVRKVICLIVVRLLRGVKYEQVAKSFYQELSNKLL